MCSSWMKVKSPVDKNLELSAKVFCRELAAGWSIGVAKKRAWLSELQMRELIKTNQDVRIAYDDYCIRKNVAKSRRLTNPRR